MDTPENTLPAGEDSKLNINNNWVGYVHQQVNGVNNVCTPVVKNGDLKHYCEEYENVGITGAPR